MTILIDKIIFCKEECESCEFVYPIPESMDIHYCNKYDKFIREKDNKYFFEGEIEK